MGRALRSPVSSLGNGSILRRSHMADWHAGDVRFLADDSTGRALSTLSPPRP